MISFLIKRSLQFGLNKLGLGLNKISLSRLKRPPPLSRPKRPPPTPVRSRCTSVHPTEHSTTTLVALNFFSTPVSPKSAGSVSPLFVVLLSLGFFSFRGVFGLPFGRARTWLRCAPPQRSGLPGKALRAAESRKRELVSTPPYPRSDVRKSEPS